MIWNEEHSLNIASGQRSVSEKDSHLEELSFSAIYYGVSREIKDEVPASIHTLCISEICRCDRRGRLPQYVLYMFVYAPLKK